MNTAQELKSFLNIGLVPTLVPASAWTSLQLGMQREAAEHSWAEIERAFRQFSAATLRPDIVLLPELAVPPHRLGALKKMAGSLGALVIAGLDFSKSGTNAENRSVVLVPHRWPAPVASRSARAIFVGKTYPAEREEQHIAAQVPKMAFSSDPTLWVFDAGELGRFGVCLCFDFMDVERPPLYRGEIHHLFVLAHNQDITSFSHIAEALCRTIYCNVVICNTGFHGGSVALTPYSEHWRRPVFQVLGTELSTTQIIRLPVEIVDRAIRHGLLTNSEGRPLKALPPGFRHKEDLRRRVERF